MNYLYEEAARTNMIEEFFKKNPKPISKGKILDIENDEPENYDVYEMPIYFFVHNWNNGRHFLESQEKIMNLKLERQELDPVKDNELIEEMLYKSKEEKNNLTKENLIRFSQQEPIIATKNGIIIDGNRRFMLLKKIWREKNLDLNQQKIKVIILKNDYSLKDLNSLETKIQFRKESKLDYDPVNKKIKIFNMYEEMLQNKGIENKIEKFKITINNEIAKEIANNTGESESKIKEYLKIISFVKWFLNSKNANNLLSLFLNKDDQLKTLYKVVNNLEDNKRKLTDIKLWFEENISNVKNMFIDASMYQILHKVKAVGSFRDIMSFKGMTILKYKDFFEKWYQETINIVGDNILEFDFSLKNKENLETKREKLEELNKNVLHDIETRRRNEIERISRNNYKSSAEIEVLNATSFIYRKLEYFNSVENISEENKKQLEEVLKEVTRFLLKVKTY